MMSCRHGLFDDRIYKKEGLTLSRNGYEVIHIAYGAESLDFISEDNIRLIQCKKQKKGTTIKSKLSALKQTFLNDLFLAAKEVKADVYHLHDVELCRIAMKLKKLPWNPKVIYDAHEPYLDILFDYWKKYSWVQNFMINTPAVLAEYYILKKVDALIATENNVANRFRKKNKNTSILYNYSYFDPTVFYREEEKQYDLIYCGGMTETKGVCLMLKALAHTKAKGYDFKLVLVGNPHIEPRTEIQMQQIIKEANLKDNVYFTGELPLEQISDYYNRSKVGLCLFPKNRVTQLILPIKLFEYISFGLPIVGSDFGHIKEFIELTDVGVLVDPHNAEDVSSAFIELLTNDNYKKYISCCIKTAKEKFLWKNQEQKLLNIYKSIHSYKCNF